MESVHEIVKKTRTGKWRKAYDDNNVQRVYRVVFLRIRRRKHNKRPCELKYLHIAKACKLTYKQVRRIMDILVKEGKIMKYKKYQSTNNTRNFYQLPAPRMTDLATK